MRLLFAPVIDAMISVTGCVQLLIVYCTIISIQYRYGYYSTTYTSTRIVSVYASDVHCVLRDSRVIYRSVNFDASAAQRAVEPVERVYSGCGHRITERVHIFQSRFL